MVQEWRPHGNSLNVESKNTKNEKNPKASIEVYFLVVTTTNNETKHSQKETHAKKKEKRKKNNLPCLNELFPLFINENVKP
jgi:hypothetical protein